MTAFIFLAAAMLFAFAIGFAIASDRPVLNSITISLLFLFGWYVFRFAYNLEFNWYTSAIFFSFLLLLLWIFKGGEYTQESTVATRARILWLLPLFFVSYEMVVQGRFYIFNLLTGPLYSDEWVMIYVVLAVSIATRYVFKYPTLLLPLWRMVMRMRSVYDVRTAFRHRYSWLSFLAVIAVLTASFLTFLFATSEGEEGLAALMYLVVSVPTYIAFAVLGGIFFALHTLMHRYVIAYNAMVAFVSTTVIVAVIPPLALLDISLFYSEELSSGIGGLVDAATVIIAPFAISMLAALGASLVVSRFVQQRSQNPQILERKLTYTTVVSGVVLGILCAPILWAGMRFTSEHGLICSVALSSSVRESCIAGTRLRTGDYSVCDTYNSHQYCELLIASAQKDISVCDQFDAYFIDWDSEYRVPDNGKAFCYAAHTISNTRDLDACDDIEPALANNCRSLRKEFLEDINGVGSTSQLPFSLETVSGYLEYIGLEHYDSNRAFMNALLR